LFEPAGQLFDQPGMEGIENGKALLFRQRLQRGELSEFSVPTYQGMGEVPRAGNDSGGGQLGNAIHCKPHGANDWLYVVVQEAVWDDLAKRVGPEIGMPEMASDARFAKISDRRKNQNLMWTLINKFAEKYTKRELMAILSVYGRKVASGDWRDYAMDFLKDRALFSIYARVSERPLFIIEKNPKLRNRQGQYLVTNQQGRILKRGHDIEQVLRVLDPQLAIVD
jgi:crotonobetainyl-CoA:carnitine CoA-transferase CaiB-like acyl-CoA transferase